MKKRSQQHLRGRSRWQPNRQKDLRGRINGKKQVKFQVKGWKKAIKRLPIPMAQGRGKNLRGDAEEGGPPYVSACKGKVKSAMCPVRRTVGVPESKINSGKKTKWNTRPFYLCEKAYQNPPQKRKLQKETALSNAAPRLTQRLLGEKGDSRIGK